MESKKKLRFLAGALFTAILTVIFDIVFHALLTHPFETPQYFESKFFFAFLAAIIVFAAMKILKYRHSTLAFAAGGALFATFASAFYTYLAPYFNVPSVYPIILGLEYNFSNFVGWVAHAICFTAAIFIVTSLFYKPEK